MSPQESVLARVVKKHGGKLCTGGDWKRSIGMEKPRANSLQAELRLRHYQVREVAQAKDGTYEVIFR